MCALTKKSFAPLLYPYLGGVFRKLPSLVWVLEQEGASCEGTVRKIPSDADHPSYSSSRRLPAATSPAPSTASSSRH